jgi:hypothetical protein
MPVLRMDAAIHLLHELPYTVILSGAKNLRDLQKTIPYGDSERSEE